MKRFIPTKNQEGLASIVIVAILVVLLSLISIGFSRVMNRALNSSLNNQLSSSASYAAQSGINDAIAYLSNPTNAASLPASPNCTSLFGAAGSGKIVQNYANGTAGYKYKCLTVDPNPPNLGYSLTQSQSQVAKISAAGGSNVSSLLFSWQASDQSKNNPASCSSLQDQTTWVNHNCPPLLRVTVYPVNGGNAMQGDSRTFFFSPSSSAPSNPVSYTSTGDGSLVPVKCNTTIPAAFNGNNPQLCNVDLSGLSSSSNLFYVRLTSMYEKGSVTIQANDGSGNVLKFSGSQYIVDVTAQAGTATKRLQAHVGFNNSDIPEDSLRSANAICKQLDVGTGTVSNLNSFCPDVIEPPQSFAPAVTAYDTNWIGNTYSQIQLVGTVNPNSNTEMPTCYFWYGQNDAVDANGVPTAEARVPCDGDNGSGIQPITGQTPIRVTVTVDVPDDNNYYWHLCASNSVGMNCAEGPGYQAPAGGCGSNCGGSDALLTSFTEPSDQECNDRYGDGLNHANNCYDYTGENLGANGPCTITIDGYVSGGAGGQLTFDPGVSGGSFTAGNDRPTTAHLNCGTNTLDLGNSITPPPTGVNVTISTPSGNYWGLNQYWMTFGTTSPQFPNDCRDGLHDFVLCFNIDANVNGDPSLIYSCDIYANGVKVNTTTNGPGGVAHWSSQGHWIAYPIGWSYAAPYTNPGNPFPFPYSYLNPSTISVTCHDYGSNTGSDSKSASWNSCGGRGQQGVYYTDYANNNCF